MRLESKDVMGFKDAIQELVDDGTVEIVNEQDAELQEEGIDITEQILTANPDVQMIWCWNQTSLLGCAAALENAQRSDIVLMGTDMSVELAKDMQGDQLLFRLLQHRCHMRWDIRQLKMQ